VITERANDAKDRENRYTFEVDAGATKGAIKEAIEKVFKVKVASVNTQIVRGKERRVGRHMGRRSNWKKAIIKLNEGFTIDVFEGR
jgi:large subunit ribosomal protein L23